MHRADAVEPKELMVRLERKFQRKVQANAERRTARRLRHRLSNFQGIDWNRIADDSLPVLG